MNKVIIINGVPRVGKDTFVQLCQKHYNDVLNISSVDFIKEVAKFCGWNGEKTPENRKFLSDLKDLLHNWDDVPFKKIKEYIDKQDKKIVFVHSREPYDIDRIKKEFSAKTLLVINPRVENNTSNHADEGVENYDYDFTINNHRDLEYFERLAIEFIKFLKEEW